MSMSDPISDLLTRIRNALTAGHLTVDIPYSKLKAEVCRVLREEGFVDEFTVLEEPVPGVIRLQLRYSPDREPVLQGLKRVSRPSLRVYMRSDDIRQVRSGLGISIISTSKGVMTNKQARNEHVGGEVLCEVW